MSIEFALSRWTLLYRKCRSIVKMIMNRVLWCTKKELLYTKHCQYISRSANVKKRSAISLLNSIRQISEKPSGVIRSPGLPWKRFVWKSWRETEPPRYEIKTSIIPLQNNVRVILRTSVVNHRSMLWNPSPRAAEFCLPNWGNASRLSITLFQELRDLLTSLAWDFCSQKHEWIKPFQKFIFFCRFVFKRAILVAGKTTLPLVCCNLFWRSLRYTKTDVSAKFSPLTAKFLF